jgi:hypothetical protein
MSEKAAITGNPTITNFSAQGRDKHPLLRRNENPDRIAIRHMVQEGYFPEVDLDQRDFEIDAVLVACAIWPSCQRPFAGR